MDDKYVEKAASVTRHGLFKYSRMPLGLRNAHAAFQRAMDVILASVEWQHAITYNDDISIFSKTLQQHLRLVKEVLRLSRNGSMTIILKKSFFFGKRIENLGHVIVSGKPQAAQNTTEAIESLQYPTTVSGLRLFLSLSNGYRRLIQNFALFASTAE